jgi:Cd2+/Zn2+-exporting ATPase
VAELSERYSVDRARQSLEELLALSPDTATVRREAEATDGSEPSERASGERTRPESRDGDRVEVPVEDVLDGETVLVEPGEKIPMDGTVTEGASAVNQAPITGESVPVDKAVGDEVFAGTINEQGFLAVETTAVAGDSTIDRVVELVEDAQANKTEREQFVERFADYYTPVVVAAALLAAFVAPVVLGGGWARWFVRGISLLVIACPCAFVISTPVTVVSGVTSAAKNGVLIKGGTHLEAMGEVDAIAFDKTGTLTTGELSVADVAGVNGNSDTDVLQCARSIERRSEHPIGDAIVAHADERDVPDREVTDFESITGKGVRADLDGRTHYAGKPGLFDDLGFDLDHVHLTTDGGVVVEDATTVCEDRDDCVDLRETIPRLQSEGKTVVLVGTEEEIEGLIAIADEVRPEARRAIERLREQGVEHFVMLTGDNERTARAVAEQVGVDDYAADLLPAEKVARVESLVEEYEDVAMVGDGINDAPALATATVGTAMGAAGTDTAIETADVALMGDDLSKLPYLHRLARTGNDVIRQNVWGSLLVKAALAVAIPLPFVAVPLWFVVLAGDVGMTTAVTGNALRLARLKPAPLTD